jgi:hypothetical protein
MPAPPQGPKAVAAEDCVAPRRPRLDAGVLPRFAPLLDRDVPHDGRAALRCTVTDGGIRVFVPRPIELHALAWQIEPGRRPRTAEPVALAALAHSHAWRSTVLPASGPAGPARLTTGFAVFDADQLFARYEFVWLRAPNGVRQADDPARETFLRPGAAGAASFAAVDPVVGLARGNWLESCGRCLRYPLGRNGKTPHLSLCRRDCLTTLSPF